ncbi:MAG: NAD(P)/FAD-dependent oxidoreductase [Lachnospiraceae bacterium]|nr:NAD(P)/FAD-dependent oxidoreductase [Lachnospiraceae bacterium]
MNKKKSIMDAVIIGAGVTGCSIARSLSRYDLDILVLEKEEDVCSGTSKANSAIIHAGFDAETGTLKAKLNVKGAKMLPRLSRELDFPYKQNGSMVLCFRREDEPGLKALYERGIANGVEGLTLMSGDEARKLEPALSKEVTMAMLASTAGIVCPFQMTAAFAENAAANGARFRFLTEVIRIEKADHSLYKVTFRDASGNEEEVDTRTVVNAAGLYSDVCHNMVSEDKLEVIPRRGEYLILDKTAGSLVSHTIFQLPSALGKGVLVTPTVHGNLLIGPNAEDVGSAEETNITAKGLAEIRSTALLSVPSVPYGQTITGFAGLRAHTKRGDFILGEPADAKGFFDAAGVESPGLSASPALGDYLARRIVNYLRKSGLSKAVHKDRKEIVTRRRGFIHAGELPADKRDALIRKDPDFGVIICRCENISAGEIKDAIRRTPGAVSMDGIKRRVRQGMGRCQAGFCTPAAMAILARELGIPEEEVCKNRPGSELLMKEE